MSDCEHCGRLATMRVRWPFNGMVERYCDDCLNEYEAGAQEIDAHEARLANEGLPAFPCPRPDVLPLSEAHDAR